MDLEGFGSCLDLVSHVDRPRFVITNGTWSTDPARTEEFLDFCRRYDCYMVVSGTPWHRRYQDRSVLEALREGRPDAVRLKPAGESFHAMGRLEGRMQFSCTHKCMWWGRALRIAVQPDGTIIFQNCDGVYPVVGDLGESFSGLGARVTKMRREGFRDVCPYSGAAV